MNIELHLSTAVTVWLDLLRILAYAVTATYLLYLLLMLVHATVEFLRTSHLGARNSGPPHRASAARDS